MSMEVLQMKSQIGSARLELEKMGASCIESSTRSMLRKLRLVNGIVVGDRVKSWDVLESLKFLQEHVSKDEAILDLGSFASELPQSLHAVGFKNLAGVDLDAKLLNMPHSNEIDYKISDFMASPFKDGQFKAVTSISVIEHGFDGQRLLKEVSRLISTGGYFLASFDYWPDKIQTDGVKFFGMDWKIFSKEEIVEFIHLGKEYGLVPFGELKCDGKDKPIECMGKQYTFGWLVLKKVGSVPF